MNREVILLTALRLVKSSYFSVQRACLCGDPCLFLLLDFYNLTWTFPPKNNKLMSWKIVPSSFLKRCHEGKEVGLKKTSIAINFLPEVMPLHSEIFKCILFDLTENILKVYILKSVRALFLSLESFFRLWMEYYSSTVSPPSTSASLPGTKTVKNEQKSVHFSGAEVSPPYFTFPHHSIKQSTYIAPTVDTENDPTTNNNVRTIICGQMSAEKGKKTVDEQSLQAREEKEQQQRPQ